LLAPAFKRCNSHGKKNKLLNSYGYDYIFILLLIVRVLLS